MTYLMDDIRKWKAVYRLLNKVETEVYDCGKLCGSACCACNKETEELGIYLFPGEHLLFNEVLNKDPAICTSENVEMFRKGDGSLQAESGLCSAQSGSSFCSAQSGMSDLKDWLEWSCEEPRELGFPDSWTEPVYFLKCRTAPHCPRQLRPLQCRTFPLKPVIGENGVLEMIWNDEDLPYQCPIIEKNMPIHDDFYKATYTVWSHLMRDQRIFDLVLSWS